MTAQEMATACILFAAIAFTGLWASVTAVAVAEWATARKVRSTLPGIAAATLIFAALGWAMWGAM